MILTSQDALKLLERERKSTADARWIDHSLTVGDTAGRIAKALGKNDVNVDIDKAITLGYLHDIGKYNGESHGHAMRGYEYLKSMDVDDEYANVCLTHSYLNNDIMCTAGGLPNPKDNPFLSEFIKNYNYSLEEKLINLCDLMCP